MLIQKFQMVKNFLNESKKTEIDEAYTHRCDIKIEQKVQIPLV